MIQNCPSMMSTETGLPRLEELEEVRVQILFKILNMCVLFVWFVFLLLNLI